jgi:hypothetical protein
VIPATSHTTDGPGIIEVSTRLMLAQTGMRIKAGNETGPGIEYVFEYLDDQPK